MQKNESTRLSRDGHSPIHTVEWRPEGEVRAVVQISHGVAEYVNRYEPFAEYLTAHGFAVVGNDHLGHGQSVAPGAPRLYFGPKGSWNTVVDDLYETHRRIGEAFPGVPCFLLGHSMGSFLARTYLIRYPGTVDGAIIMGTGQQGPLLLLGGRLVAALESLRIGADHISPLVQKLAFGAYNRPFAPNRTGSDWLSVDEGNVDRYISDPLCGGNASVGLFREMLWGIGFITKPENLRKMDLSTPIHFVSGAMDPVGDMGKGVRKAYESFRAAGVRQVTMHLYPEARHEILNDCWRETVYDDLRQWLEAQPKGAAVS